MFQTDEHFVIGADHVREGEPCEDYAHSGHIGDAAFAVVADGCSSGGMTDVGARLTCLAVVAALRNRVRRGKEGALSPHELIDEQNSITKTIRETLGLRAFDMQATCLCVYRTLAGGFIHVRGDGAFATVGRDGTIRAGLIEWPVSTPYYPAYQDKDLTTFVQAHGGDLDAPIVRLTRWTRQLGMVAECTTERFTLAQGIEGIVETIPADTAFVAVFSDGVTQCGMEWHEAVARLLAFKGVAGSFAKRRMIRFAKEVKSSGTDPADDLSYAVIRADLETEKGESHVEQSESTA